MSCNHQDSVQNLERNDRHPLLSSACTRGIFVRTAGSRVFHRPFVPTANNSVPARVLHPPQQDQQLNCQNDNKPCYKNIVRFRDVGNVQIQRRATGTKIRYQCGFACL